jgi:hypothetical protein
VIALAKALTLYSREALNDIIAVWDLTFLRLYYQDGLGHARNQELMHRYRCMRLEELVKG